MGDDYDPENGDPIDGDDGKVADKPKEKKRASQYQIFVMPMYSGVLPDNVERRNSDGKWERAYKEYDIPSKKYDGASKPNTPGFVPWYVKSGVPPVHTGGYRGTSGKGQSRCLNTVMLEVDATDTRASILKKLRAMPTRAVVYNDSYMIACACGLTFGTEKAIEKHLKVFGGKLYSKNKKHDRLDILEEEPDRPHHEIIFKTHGKPDEEPEQQKDDDGEETGDDDDGDDQDGDENEDGKAPPGAPAGRKKTRERQRGDANCVYKEYGCKWYGSSVEDHATHETTCKYKAKTFWMDSETTLLQLQTECGFKLIPIINKPRIAEPVELDVKTQPKTKKKETQQIEDDDRNHWPNPKFDWPDPLYPDIDAFGEKIPAEQSTLQLVLTEKVPRHARSTFRHDANERERLLCHCTRLTAEQRAETHKRCSCNGLNLGINITKYENPCVY